MSCAVGSSVTLAKRSAPSIMVPSPPQVFISLNCQPCPQVVSRLNSREKNLPRQFAHNWTVSRWYIKNQGWVRQWDYFSICQNLTLNHHWHFNDSISIPSMARTPMAHKSGHRPPEFNQPEKNVKKLLRVVNQYILCVLGSLNHATGEFVYDACNL